MLTETAHNIFYIKLLIRKELKKLFLQANRFIGEGEYKELLSLLRIHEIDSGVISKLQEQTKVCIFCNNKNCRQWCNFEEKIKDLRKNDFINTTFCCEQFKNRFCNSYSFAGPLEHDHINNRYYINELGDLLFCPWCGKQFGGKNDK